VKILGFFVRITKKSNNTTIYDEKKPCKSLFLRAPNRGKNPRQQKGRLFLEPSKRLRVISCAGAMPVRRLKHEKTPDVLGHFLICACPSKLKMPPQFQTVFPIVFRCFSHVFPIFLASKPRFPPRAFGLNRGEPGVRRCRWRPSWTAGWWIPWDRPRWPSFQAVLR
jgi:hypothetical protein